MRDIQYGTIDLPKIERPETLSEAEMDRRVAETKAARAQARYEAAAAEEAALQRRIDEATRSSIANSQFLRFGGTARAAVNEGRMAYSDPNPQAGGRSAIGHIAKDPATLPINVGGLQLSPEQARAFLADGTITREQYSAGMTAAMQPYQPGYKHSFR